MEEEKERDGESRHDRKGRHQQPACPGTDVDQVERPRRTRHAEGDRLNEIETAEQVPCQDRTPAPGAQPGAGGERGQANHYVASPSGQREHRRQYAQNREREEYRAGEDSKRVHRDQRGLHLSRRHEPSNRRHQEEGGNADGQGHHERQPKQGERQPPGGADAEATDGRDRCAFAHVYGPHNTDAVIRVSPFEPGPDGIFTFSVDAQSGR